MDLIKPGSCIANFYSKICATTKASTMAGYHVVLATLLLQGLKLCAQKTAVVEMDEIFKFRFVLNQYLGSCHNALQYENMHFYLN